MSRIEKRVKFFRETVKMIDRSKVLTTIMDRPGLEAVIVVEPSIISMGGVSQKVNPGKIMRLSTFGRTEIESWIKNYNLSVEPYLVPKVTTEYDRFEKVEPISSVETVVAVESEIADNADKPEGFRMSFGSAEQPKPKPKPKGGRPKKS